MNIKSLLSEIEAIRDESTDYFYGSNLADKHKKDFVQALKDGKISEVEAKKFVLLSMEYWEDKIIEEMTCKIFDKKNPISWEKDSGFIDEVFALLQKITERPKTGINRREAYYHDFFKSFLKMLKVNKQLPRKIDLLYGFIKRSLELAVSESELDLGAHDAAFAISSEFPWKDHLDKMAEAFHLIVAAVKHNPMLSRKLDLSHVIKNTTMYIYQALSSNTKGARKILDDVTDLVHFCEEEEWQDEDESDENSLAYNMLADTLNDYLNSHAEAEFLKPNLDVVKRLWECGDDILQRNADYIMSSISGNAELLGDDSATVIDNFLSGKDQMVISSFGDLFKSKPELFYDRIDEFVEAVDDAEDWIAMTAMNLFWEISKKKPDIFTDSHIKMFAKYLSSEMTVHMVMQVFNTLAAKFPEKIVKYDQQLMDCMKRLGDQGAFVGTILAGLARTGEANAKKYLKFLWGVLQNVSPMVKVGLLYNFRQIGTSHGLEMLQEFKPQLLAMLKVPELKESVQSLIDVMEGRTLENLAQGIEEQKEDITELDERVATNENNISDIKTEVDEIHDDVNDVKWDVKRQEGRVDDLEEVVEDTVDKVEEIDRKTLSHAPAWSRDVSKLMNQEQERDWRLLASRLGYNKDDIKNWATQPDPCLSMFDEWFATHKTREATFAIHKALQEMDRVDAAMIVENALKNVEGVVEEDEEELVDPPPIFISYQWAHQDEVKLLKRHLEMAGYKSWMDIGQMGGGDKLFAKIDEGIRAAKLVICCVSEKYAQSPNCNREVNLSVTLGKPVIPLLMEKMSWPPPGSMGPIFSEYLFVRFFQRAAEATKDSRYWPADKFQELLMQLRYTMVPDEDLIEKEYKGWWNPPEELIVIKPKQDKKSSAKSAVKSSKDADNEVAPSPDVFISYQWGKQPQIKVLYRRLVALGLTCWLDIMQMGGGDSLYDKIDKGIRGSKVVLSCITTKYGLSANCRREVSLADALKKPIVPLLLERTSWPPEGPMGMVFTQLLYINFTKPDDSVQNHWKCDEFSELLIKIGDSVLSFDAHNAIGSPKDPKDSKAVSGNKPKASTPKASTPKASTPATEKKSSAQTNDSGDKPKKSNATVSGEPSKPKNKEVDKSSSPSATPRPDTSMKKKSGVCQIL